MMGERSTTGEGAPDVPYAGEEIASSETYISGYEKPRPIDAQVDILRRHFPQLAAPDASFASAPLPAGAEGFFAVPTSRALGEDYVTALRAMLAALKTAREGVFYNNRGEQIDPDRLRQRPECLEAFERISERQGHPDIMIIPAQFGLRHRGRSVRRARAMFSPNEFGLTSVQVGAMVLTHPDRFRHDDDLKVDCPADEFDDPAAENRFGRTPCFNYDHEQLEFGTHWTDRAYEINSTASGFLAA